MGHHTRDEQTWPVGLRISFILLSCQVPRAHLDLFFDTIFLSVFLFPFFLSFFFTLVSFWKVVCRFPASRASQQGLFCWRPFYAGKLCSAFRKLFSFPLPLPLRVSPPCKACKGPFMWELSLPVAAHTYAFTLALAAVFLSFLPPLGSSS